MRVIKFFYPIYFQCFDKIIFFSERSVRSFILFDIKLSCQNILEEMLKRKLEEPLPFW